MRISDAVSPARPLEVHFATGTLNIEYRPSSYTIAEADKLVTESAEFNEQATPEQKRERLHKVADTIASIIVAWDLEHDDGTPISPQDKDALAHIPMSIFTEIIGAVNADQKVTPGEAEPSDAS